MIKIKNLSKIYGEGEIAVKALDNISFEVSKGEFVAIMGPSGSGKSTLMNILGCLDTPNFGEYSLDDMKVSELSDKELAKIRNKKIGFIFQTFNLLPRLTAQKNVEQPMIYKGTTRKERENISKKVLEDVGLGDRIDHKPSELSGGQRQRVAIARSLVNDPQIILADEPTGNLDSESEEDILEILTSLNNSGITIIMVTHDKKVAQHAERIVNFKDGKIIREENIKNAQRFELKLDKAGGVSGEIS
ncbi:MAG: ABC transporter ATP-binding protein [Bacillota bacterium]